MGLCPSEVFFCIGLCPSGNFFQRCYVRVGFFPGWVMSVYLYIYLGIKFSYNGRLCTARKQLTEQATKTMYRIFSKKI